MRDFINLIEMYSSLGTFYHVTERENVTDILQNGFLGGWGDAGLGVYLYDNIHDAQTYAEKGGWDAGLEDPAILEIHSDEVCRVPVLSNEWDATLYENMWWYEMEDEDERWSPIMRVHRK